ncbi:hypothetical protein G7085_16565 [Tessaracoccus sp. HDW20]|uniref:hypothetical protein n=1 Tax=Tessaracoccus coleopterorum TaxID=2714950 RepID=UPI0018D38AC4|nr:hypothetical protein [Tessaracoccus coleopterorum]NHB85663.1 hypothetical protein [Tessaracoccus coleopterorum]
MTRQHPAARAIASRLAPDTMFRTVELVASTGSTNADLAGRAREGEAEGSPSSPWSRPPVGDGSTGSG